MKRRTVLDLPCCTASKVLEINIVYDPTFSMELGVVLRIKEVELGSS
jgi:hypothetical protein